jgi:hypothetical protein
MTIEQIATDILNAFRRGGHHVDLWQDALEKYDLSPVDGNKLWTKLIQDSQFAKAAKGKLSSLRDRIALAAVKRELGEDFGTDDDGEPVTRQQAIKNAVKWATRRYNDREKQVEYLKWLRGSGMVGTNYYPIINAAIKQLGGAG